jgi:hypothetical protein
VCTKKDRKRYRKFHGGAFKFVSVVLMQRNKQGNTGAFLPALEHDSAVEKVAVRKN